MSICNICGGVEFEPGPNGRLTPSGEPIRCSGCRSLERHRSVHDCLARVPSELLAWRRAIQFAPDGSLDPSWFTSYEESQYEGDNSLDLQAIERPDASYDFISLSSVLEFVPDDRRAFGELLRIGSANCVIHCTYAPLADETTHYDAPHGTFGRYHLYGADVDDWFKTREQGLSTVMAIGVDPVTGVEEPIHFYCRDAGDAEVLRTALSSATA